VPAWCLSLLSLRCVGGGVDQLDGLGRQRDGGDAGSLLGLGAEDAQLLGERAGLLLELRDLMSSSMIEATKKTKFDGVWNPRCSATKGRSGGNTAKTTTPTLRSAHHTVNRSFITRRRMRTTMVVIVAMTNRKGKT
jgi:hypothetical protein